MSVLASGTLSSNTSTSTVTLGNTREYSIGASGTFGGGSLVAELSVNSGTTWISVGSAGTLTSAGWFVVTPPRGALLRLTLSGAAGPSVAWTVNE